MKNKVIAKLVIAVGLTAGIISGCATPSEVSKTQSDLVAPKQFGNVSDSTNTKAIEWKKHFSDPNLIALIDSALYNNQELNIMLQEMNIAKYEIRGRKGDIFPSAELQVGAGVDKAGEFTRNGAVEKNLPVHDGQAFPEAVPDFLVGINASWEVDIWRKLRNSRDAAIKHYLATEAGKNFMITKLVSEIASSYYELMALDNKLEILNQNIEIQKNALDIVRLQKIGGEVTELAVKKFEAEVLKNQSKLYFIHQQIIEMENRINFLVGRYPQPVSRSSATFQTLTPDTVFIGFPSQLLQNRPDIIQSEMNLAAARLDVKVTKAEFYPSLRIRGGIGYNAFNPKYLVTTPQSLMYNVLGDLVTPLINRNAIKAKFYTANAKQVQAIYQYEQTLLNAFVEVTNRVSKIENLKRSYELKVQQVDALTNSVTISTSLFTSGNAEYMEVLMTQRDAVEAKMELIEIKQEQLTNWVNMYQALGGGW